VSPFFFRLLPIRSRKYRLNRDRHSQDLKQGQVTGPMKLDMFETIPFFSGSYSLPISGSDMAARQLERPVPMAWMATSRPRYRFVVSDPGAFPKEVRPGIIGRIILIGFMKQGSTGTQRTVGKQFHVPYPQPGTAAAGLIPWPTGYPLPGGEAVGIS